VSRVATPSSEAERQRARYRWLTTRQAGERLGVSGQHVRDLVAAEALAAMDVRLPGAPKPEYRIAEDSVDAFIAARSNGAKASA
jgi:excisionase family DNA binding protein